MHYFFWKHHNKDFILIFSRLLFLENEFYSDLVLLILSNSTRVVASLVTRVSAFLISDSIMIICEILSKIMGIMLIKISTFYPKKRVSVKFWLKNYIIFYWFFLYHNFFILKFNKFFYDFSYFIKRKIKKRRRNFSKKLKKLTIWKKKKIF